MVPAVYWSALMSAVLATVAVVAFWERGHWRLGLVVAPVAAAREFAAGAAVGATIIVIATAAISASTNVSHAIGRGFPWSDLLIVYVPAVLNEELMFRGYPFQKLRQSNRRFAVFFSSACFASLHAGNAGFTLLALLNVFLGGVLLALAYERYERLWLPIGLHLAWNLTSGPILGDEVSGYGSARSLLIERGSGPVWLTGGTFGLEASVWMTVVEIAAISFMLHRSNNMRAPGVTARQGVSV
jgi:membrane protease YdiL (CAAX protease family)